MNKATDWLNQDLFSKVHEKSLEILGDTGVAFHSEAALSAFKKHGFKTAGCVVFFSEKQIHNALATLPSGFTLCARNHDNDVMVGVDYIFVPGFGAATVMDNHGVQRDSTMEDFDNFSKLTQSSMALDCNSAVVIQPRDLPSETCHINMLASAMLLTDKPLMANTSSGKAVRDSLDMARIVWGENFDNKIVLMGLVDSLAPSAFTQESADALVQLSEAGQSVIIHSGAIFGVTGPITFIGSLTLSNAVNLAGICLTQLVRPGAPVIYGLDGSPMNLKNGHFIVATPEEIRSAAITPKIAAYYNIPCRTLIGLTDSYAVDYQAGMESAAMPFNSLNSGPNVAVHSCGTMGAISSMNYSKFILDEQMCLTAKSSIAQIQLDKEAWAMELINELNGKSEYLQQQHTVKRCRDFFVPDIYTKENHTQWYNRKERNIVLRAETACKERLMSYQKPDIAPDLEKDIHRFLNRRTG